MKIDPYAIISLGAAEHQTSVASGTSPTWKDESMEFPVEVPDSEELQLVLKVGIKEDHLLNDLSFQFCCTGHASQQDTQCLLLLLHGVACCTVWPIE